MTWELGDQGESFSGSSQKAGEREGPGPEAQGLWEKRNVQEMFGEVAANSLLERSSDTLRKIYSPHYGVGQKDAFRGSGEKVPRATVTKLHTLSASHGVPRKAPREAYV